MLFYFFLWLTSSLSCFTLFSFFFGVRLSLWDWVGQWVRVETQRDKETKRQRDKETKRQRTLGLALLYLPPSPWAFQENQWKKYHKGRSGRPQLKKENGSLYPHEYASYIINIHEVLKIHNTEPNRLSHSLFWSAHCNPPLNYALPCYLSV